MKKIWILWLLVVLIASCRTITNKTSHQGGSIAFPINAKPTAWIPSLAYDINTMIVLNQLYEGLVEIDQQSYQVKSLLAKTIENSFDYKEYTFELHSNVHFHPHSLFQGDSTETLTNNDVIQTFEYACSKKYHESSYAYQNILKEINGAEAYHRGECDTIEGLYEENGKITIKLKKSDPLFLQKLASSTLGIFSAKWINNQQGVPPGTGPFYLKSKDDKTIILRRHPYYFKESEEKYRLPYLDNIVFKVYEDEQVKINDFLTGRLDIINSIDVSGLNTIFEEKKEAFNQIPPELTYFNNPLLQATMVLFNLNTPLLESSTNRKLMNYAINRDEVNRVIIHNQGLKSSIYGLIPPVDNVFNLYDYEQLNRESLKYNPERIKKSKLTDFASDTLILNVLNESQRIKLGNLLKQQFKKELHLEVQINTLSSEEMIVSIEKMDADLYLIGLSAEFLNPLSLMKHFYGETVPDSLSVPSTVNFSRYKNWYFDQFYEKASKEYKASKQFNAILLSEKELLKNPPFIVLYYNADNYVHYTYVCNLHSNLLNLIKFRDIYLNKKVYG